MDIRKLVRISLVASVPLALGLALAKPAAALDALGGYGDWTAYTGGAGSGRFCAMKTDMTRGGWLAVTFDRIGVHLLISDPQWSMTAGNTVRLQVTVDGNSFSGHGTVMDDGRSITVHHLANGFLHELIMGEDAFFSIGGVRWNISLNGTEATGNLVYSCARAAGI